MQATAAASQGYTIMVFTIVTVIFVSLPHDHFLRRKLLIVQLPMSFIAAIFAINIKEFPRASDGSQSLPLSYVSKYTCKHS